MWPRENLERSEEASRRLHSRTRRDMSKITLFLAHGSFVRWESMKTSVRTRHLTPISHQEPSRVLKYIKERPDTPGGLFGRQHNRCCF